MSKMTIIDGNSNNKDDVRVLFLKGEPGKPGEPSGSPLVASSISGMTDTTKVYVNTTDGHWYWYNGSSWQDGGIYQATVTDAVIDENSVLFNSEEIGSNGIKLYGRSLSVNTLVIYPNLRVNNVSTQYSFYANISKNKYYYIKKSSTNMRFRVGLLKEAPPTETLDEPLPIANVIYDDNDGTTCAFYSGDYEHLIIYVGYIEPTNTCMLYEDVTPNNNPLFLISDKKDKFEKEVTNDLLMNYNNSSLWEIGGINSSTGANTTDNSFIRLKTYIDADTIEIIRDKVNSMYDTGIRLYNKNGTYNSGLLKYDSIYNMPANTKNYKIRIIIKKNSGSITESEIPQICSIIKLTKKGSCVPVSKGIDTSWTKWNDVRYNYGFDINKTPIYNEVKGVFETDTMFSVKGGKGRWSDNLQYGGHLFEGWSKNDLSRYTTLIGKQGQMIADIFVYSPAGLLEEERRFGWVKVGSDEVNKGVDFSNRWVKFYNYMILHNSNTTPTFVDDADINPQLSQYQNSVPTGTMYYDTSVNKVRVMTNNGWKYLKFED